VRQGGELVITTGQYGDVMDLSWSAFAVLSCADSGCSHFIELCHHLTARSCFELFWFLLAGDIFLSEWGLRDQL